MELNNCRGLFHHVLQGNNTNNLACQITSITNLSNIAKHDNKNIDKNNLLLIMYCQLCSPENAVLL